MGHALLVPFARTPEWPASLKHIARQRFQILAMTRAPARFRCAIVAVGDAKVAILVGAEGPGLTETVMRADLTCGSRCRAERRTQIAATAAALAFYERIRLARRDRRADTLGHWAG